MAYYDTIQLVKGDTLPELNLTLRDSNAAAAGQILDSENSSTWAPIDLTGATALKSTITMTLQAPYTDGKVFMQWPTGVLDTAGTFTGEVEVTYSSGAIPVSYTHLTLPTICSV